MVIRVSLAYQAKSNTKSHCLTTIWIHLHSTYIFPPRHTLPNTPCLSVLTLTGSFAITLAGICCLTIQWCSLSLGYVLQLLNNLQFYLLSTIGMMSILYFIVMYLLTQVIWSLFQLLFSPPNTSLQFFLNHVPTVFLPFLNWSTEFISMRCHTHLSHYYKLER